MRLTRLPLDGAALIEVDRFADERGWFMESFHEHRFNAGLVAQGLAPARPFVQDNHSCSRRGVLRGLHMQVAPHAQGKLVRVVRGSIWDVLVDLRPSSPTRGKWHAVELSAENRTQAWIPEGFAHGFLALEEDTHVLYKTTDVYARECERSIRWDDPTLGIDWPLNRIDGPIMISEKDHQAPNWSPRS